MPRKLHAAILLSFSIVLLSLCGCTRQTLISSAPAPTPASATIHGMAHGGLQPITGATVQLYAVGYQGDGSASTALISSPVITTSDGTGIGGNASNSNNTLAPGSFTITSDYTCPAALPSSTPANPATLVTSSSSPLDYVYIVITGGSSGGGANSNIALMAALGECSTLSSSTMIDINEVTTVAAVYALAPFMTSTTSIGASYLDSAALGGDFALATEYANYANGSSPGLNVQANQTVPSAQINTIANILSSCINTTGGHAGDSTICGQLFTATTPSGGSAPADTITATLDLVNNATTVSPSTLFGLITAGAPYAGLSSAPANWTVAMSTVTSSPLLATGDSRTVTQPTYPSMCTLAATNPLIAQFPISDRAVGSVSSSSDDTTRLQAALTACANTGQSVVLAVNTTTPADTAFLASSELTITGETLVINSGVTLYGNDGYVSSSNPLILMSPSSNSSLTALMGPGTIDGRGDLVSLSNKNRLVQSTNVVNGIVYNVTLTQSVYPNLYVQGGNGFTIWDVSIRTPSTRANADGIDIDSLTNATVTNSSIEAGDDGVAVKSNVSNVSNVTVQNNRLYGTHGLSIGSIVSNTVTNILFQNNTINSADLSDTDSALSNGINVKVDPCALSVSQVTYLNTCMINVKHLLMFCNNYTGGSCSTSSCSSPGTAGVPSVSDVVVNGVFTTSSQSGAYEYFNGFSAADAIDSVYLANLNLDKVSLNTNQYVTYYLDNTGTFTSAKLTGGTGVTVNTFTTTGSVPTCSF